MSKSVKRVLAEAETLGLSVEIIRKEESTKTAQEAADAMGCEVDQILKSIIFLGKTSGECILFMTAGGNRVDMDKASALAGEELRRADAAVIREQTGFAIGGVSPLGYKNPIRKFMDQRLLDFDVIWAAAGTPNDNFSIDPSQLQRATDVIISPFGQ